MKQRDASFFADVAARFDAAVDAAGTLACVAECASEAADGADAAVLVVGRGGKAESAASTSPVARQADLLSLEYSEGPSLAAIATGQIVVTGELATDRRWPRWGPAAAAAGFQSALSVRLQARGRTIGALDLYSGRRKAFGPGQLRITAILARHAAIALAAARQEDGLQTAMHSRAIVGQAQGVLMERYRLSPDHAFEMLRRHSQERNVKLRLLAETVVAARRLPGVEPAESSARP